MNGLGQKRSAETISAEFERKWGSVDRILWMQRQPSVVSGETPCVNAHMDHEGVARKGHHTTIVPLTDAEHRSIHDHGIKTFCAKYSIAIDWLLAQAAEVEQRWQAFAASEARLPW